MSPIRIIILLLALVAAGGAALLVSRMSQPQVVTETVTRDNNIIEKEQVSEIKVLTASRDLTIGEQIKAEDLQWSIWPELGVAEGQYTETAAPGAVEELTGAVVKMPIYKLEPIMPQRVVKRGEAGLLPVLMGEDMRAVSIGISPESASGGFILPNDRVDLILTYEQTPSATNGLTSARTVSMTVLQNVRVLAIDQTYAPGEPEESTRIGQTATLEVLPSEAELVALSQSKGQLSLALRPLNDLAVSSPRKPRLELNGGDEGEGAVMIIRNSQPTLTAMGSN
ncbi:pilus assembly protein CpaB [Hyphomonas neptunium ATCC 15444]|uniref:Pilus assembly protein CpaB n=2 Tax=Hyphomonas TaxID=85 RepID=Q0BXV1_HYPNA|nr:MULTISPECIES: Flp pilus assembly protein CpaB [Hyphomonas]ABI77371.1 pilus assembly protein CpaB [Hyphomonas neptunium ATCC 15444]KCZ93617.1 pilus assembly protein CpaB [Hyphomonas hirschiana VP5]